MLKAAFLTALERETTAEANRFAAYLQLEGVESRSAALGNQADRYLSFAWRRVQEVLRASPLPVSAALDTVTVKAIANMSACAFTVAAEDGVAIVVDADLIGFVETLVETTFAASHLASPSGQMDATYHPMERMTAARVARISLGHLRWNGVLWRPVVFDFPEAMNRLISRLTGRALMFVLAHEYGHYALGHLEQSNKDETLRMLPVLRPFEHQEFGADLFAAKAILAGDQDFESRGHWLLAIRLALSALRQLDDVYYYRAQDSHPQASERLLAVLASLDTIGDLLSKRHQDLIGIVDETERDLVAQDHSGADLVSLVRGSSNVSWAFESLTEADRASDEYQVQALDAVEGIMLMPISNCLAAIGKLAYGDSALSSVPPPLTAAIRAVAHDLTAPETEDELDEAVELVGLGVAGEIWLFSELRHHLQPDGGLTDPFSPRPGTPFHAWIDALGESFSTDERVLILRACDYYRRLPPDQRPHYPSWLVFAVHEHLVRVSETGETASEPPEH